jgi:organic hydroperoxide reductase OsmC/OhrA
MRAIYTTEATAHGGRDGHIRSSDGLLDLDLRVPESTITAQVLFGGT